MRVGALMFEDMLKSLEINYRNMIGEKRILDLLDQKGASTILLDFKGLWADMGDHISEIYAGTGASTT